MTSLQPRFVRLKDAPGYLGMDRHRFNAEVRPRLTEIPIGTQGIAFDRIELDDWADYHKRACGRPPVVEEDLCPDKSDERQGSGYAEVSGIFRSN